MSTKTTNSFDTGTSAGNHKTVALTGGASGIGAATLTRLEARGCTVYVLDRIAPKSQDALHIECNLAEAASIEAALAALPTQIDSVINVAGVATLPDERDTIAINFLGLRMVTEMLLPRLRPGGSVVNVASTAGWKWREHITQIQGLLDTPDFAAGKLWLLDHPDLWQDAPYHFSKRCAAAYTYRATQLALPFGVRVNCINPGVTETQLSPQFRSLVGDQLYDWGIEQIGRAGRPEDIAEVVEFLAIGQCGWLNGQELVVDGGYIAGLTGGWIDPSKAPS